MRQTDAPRDALLFQLEQRRPMGVQSRTRAVRSSCIEEEEVDVATAEGRRDCGAAPPSRRPLPIAQICLIEITA